MKISFNPDRGVRDEAFKAVQDNQGYCPCKLIKTLDTKCICKDFREQQEEGPCHCGLYIKTK